MQLRAMAIARCVLPVPVPPTSTALRCWARNVPPARSRTRVSLIGVPANWKLSRSLVERQLGDAELVFYRARLLLAGVGSEQIPDEALGFVLAFDRRSHDLVEGGHATRSIAE